MVPAMSDRDAVIAKLIAARADLERRGVEKLWLFGSMARGEDRPDSDVDLAFRWAAGVPPDVLTWGELAVDLRELLGRSVDVGPLEALRPSVDAAARDDLLEVF